MAGTTRTPTDRVAGDQRAPAPDGDPGMTRAQRAHATDDLLTRAYETDDLAERRRLLDEIIVINRGVAEAVAARYRNRGVAMDDLQQAAYEGLTKAVLRFDPSRGKDLLTYAVPTIRGELQRHFRDHGWTVRPPRRVQELQWQVNSCIEGLTQQLGHEPSDGEIRRAMDLTDAEYQDAMTAYGCFQPTSLDQPLAHDSAATLGELIPDDGSEEGELEAADARTTLAPVVRQLPERDRRILYLRFFEDQTQEEIGRELGVTQMQVSRLLARILRDLRDQLADGASANPSGHAA